jgi:hypothetical protein
MNSVLNKSVLYILYNDVRCQYISENYRMLPTLDKFYSLMSNKNETRNTAMYLFFALDKRQSYLDIVQ